MTDKVALRIYGAREYADATHSLLPPGQAWNWDEGGFGDTLMLGVAQELARIDAAKNGILNAAIELHRPHYMSWRLSDYQAVADTVVAIIQEALPREPFVAGSVAGDRLWEPAEPGEQVPVRLVRCEHLVGPFITGEAVSGNRLCSTPYMLLVWYYASVVDPYAIRDALLDFAQGHVSVYMIDVTGWGGDIS